MSSSITSLSPAPACWLICCDQARQDIQETRDVEDSDFCRFRVDANWVEFVAKSQLRERMVARLAQPWAQVRVVVQTLEPELARAVGMDWLPAESERICCYQYRYERSAVLDALLVPDAAVTTCWLLEGRPPQVRLEGVSLNEKLSAGYQQAFTTYWEIAQENYGEEAFDFPLPNGQVIWGLFSAKLPKAANDPLYEMAAYKMAAASYGRLEGAPHETHPQPQALLYERHWVYPAEASELEQDHLHLSVSETAFGGLQLAVRAELSRERWQHTQPTQVQIFLQEGTEKLALKLIPGGELKETLRQTHTAYLGDEYVLDSAFSEAATLDQARIQILGQMLPYDEDDSVDIDTDTTGSDT